MVLGKKIRGTEKQEQTGRKTKQADTKANFR